MKPTWRERLAPRARSRGTGNGVANPSGFAPVESCQVDETVHAKAISTFVCRYRTVDSTPMSSDEIEELGGGPSPEGHRGGAHGTGEFMGARATVHREDGTVRTVRLEVSAHNFHRAPEAALVGALQESGVELEEADEIEIDIGGETLTLRQTGWEIQ